MILFLVEECNIVRSAKRAKSHLGDSCGNELVSLRIKFFTAFLWNKNIFSHIDLLQEGLNGVNRLPSNGLKFNRQPSKKDIFHRQTSKMQSNINRKSVSRYFKSHYFSWSSKTVGS